LRTIGERVNHSPVIPLKRRRVIELGRPAGLAERLIAAAVAAGCVATVAVGLSLQPSPRGLGTHEQLGLPPCQFLLTTGMPCPTCGATTAFAAMVHGRPVQAFRAHPLGAVLALVVVVAAAMALTTALGAISWLPLLRRLPWQSIALGGAALWVGSWIYKILAVKLGL